MSERNSVSVVIPTHGRPLQVVQAVRSALRQTHSPLEVIVVVDGADPRTTEALATIVDPRLRVLAQAENMGGSAARNVGIENSRGAWIAFLDDDDEWLPQKLELQLEVALASGRKFPVISTGVFLVRAGETFVLPVYGPMDSEPVAEYLFRRRSITQPTGFMPTSCLMAPRELLELEEFRPGQPRLQDADLVLRLVARPEVSFHWVPEPLVIYNDLSFEARVSRKVTWEYWLEWLRENRCLLTRKAYAGALLNIVTTYAAGRHRNWEAAFPILDEAFAKGSPGINDLCAYVTR